MKCRIKSSTGQVYVLCAHLDQLTTALSRALTAAIRVRRCVCAVASGRLCLQLQLLHQQADTLALHLEEYSSSLSLVRRLARSPLLHQVQFFSSSTPPNCSFVRP